MQIRCPPHRAAIDGVWDGAFDERLRHGTASISRDSYKRSLAATAPRGIFLDLAVLAAAPVRMIRAGLGDVLCRSTAQVDWLLSHLLLEAPYAKDPFAIQAADERTMLDRAGGLAKGDPEAILALVRLLVLSGLGMLFVGSSHPGSMGEHDISHYIDMLLRPHPGSLHGEQVGVASLTMARLQAEIFSQQELPWLVPEALAGKAGAATRPEDLGIARGFYRDAALHAREIREHYGMLDLACDAGLLEALVGRLDR